MSAGRPPVVVADASPLIALRQIGRLQLLADLFGQVIVPPAVAREVAGDVPLLPYVVVQPLAAPVPQVVIAARLGAGESEAIALALAVGAGRLILDDLPARRLALSLHLPVVGILGLLLAGKQAGLLASVSAEIDALATHRFRLAPAVVEQVLRMAGERT
jgi:predicted nucleic acid-binding protein